LNLTRNLLEGSIPEALGRRTRLSYLDLGMNHLQGELPSEIGSLQSIVFLRLFHNHLSGLRTDPTIPSQPIIDKNFGPWK
jgi:hypothetical protein